LAALRATVFEFDVWPAGEDPWRCCADAEVRPGDAFVWVRTSHAPPLRARSGFGHCLECGRRRLLEHRRLLADVEWRVEREAAQLAEQRARALAEQMLTYESPPEDALFEGTVTLGETLPTAAGGAPPVATAATDPEAWYAGLRDVWERNANGPFAKHGQGPCRMVRIASGMADHRTPMVEFQFEAEDGRIVEQRLHYPQTLADVGWARWSALKEARAKARAAAFATELRARILESWGQR
jgi:hypothetical protein